MATINYIRICVSQNREDLLPPLPSSQKFFGKKRSPEQIASELRIQRSNYRSNQCSECFTAKASNGSCNC